MKRLLSLTLIIALFAIVFQSCNKESNDNELAKAQVEFTFSASMLKITNEQILTNVVVTIEDLQGNVVINSEKIELYNMNGNYISKPISLLTGDYKLSRFMVLDGSNNVVYASPMAGSAKAYLVKKPLSIEFTAQKDIVTKLSSEVLITINSCPEDFGYATFSFDIAETFDFLVGAFVYDSISQNFELTSATISIYTDTTLIYTGQLEANAGITTINYDDLGITNIITLPEKYNTFTIKISKEGYTNYNKNFTKEELLLHYRKEDKGPLVVVLEKGSACDFAAEFYAGPIVQVWPRSTIYIENLSDSHADSYIWDFGDGTIQNETTYNSNFNKEYRAPGIYIIKLTVTKNGCSASYEQEISILPVGGGESTVTDIDGNIYHTVTIGTQVWMVENLKVTKYNDGNVIPYVTDSVSWGKLQTPAYCFYNNDIKNKTIYGALYNWYSVNTGKLAPNGWHVAKDSEWKTLITFLGDPSNNALFGEDSIAGGKMMEIGTSHWIGLNSGANNSSGFTALPGGGRFSDYLGSFFRALGSGA